MTPPRMRPARGTKTAHRTARLLAPLLLTTLVCACSFLPRGGGYFEDDGPEAHPPADAAAAPDAVPQIEARSRSGNSPYSVYGVTYRPVADAGGYRERGVASWYGKKFHGRRASSGEAYDMYAMTAAHKTLPLPSYVRVRNLQNGRAVIVRVNDRGPFLNNRLIDLSYAAAARLGILGSGTGVVEVETVGPGETSEPAPAAKPKIEIIPAAAADQGADNPPAGARLYLQVGAFTEWDNAASLRERLERAQLRPIFIQSTLVAAESPNGADAQETDAPPDQARIYRVRIGPLPSVAEGDRLTELAAQHGVAGAKIVVE